ncbi:MAG: hypothetical protein LBJ67_00565 [Planctomycetaceae bacterium]|jgi:hypothetical protein|nr:hypothetical protein [Planctomycetaceae bacterium]
MSKFILGLGAGQCGLKLFADILNVQPGTKVTCEETPLLPWEQSTSHLVGCEEHRISISDRLTRWRQQRQEFFIGDAASSYLPYVEEAIRLVPDIRMVCLQRPKFEIVSSFCNSLNDASRRPVDNWSRRLANGWYRDPLRMNIYPKYETSSREAALNMYYDEYYTKAEIFAQRFPENFLLIDTENLTRQEGVRKVLTFVGIPVSDQKLVTGECPNVLSSHHTEDFILSRWQAELQQRPKSHCVILVPFLGYIHQECDASLKELERRGYLVRRVGGYSAIDQGRNQMVTDALVDGFEETFWIDSDIDFRPDDIEKIREHQLPIVVGIYPQKGRRALASHIIPGAANMTFGQKGGLVEMLYGGTGFMLVRREVYLTMQERLNFPICNDRFGQPMIPYFQPLVRRIEEGYWYLAEDYAFCHRARACGYQVAADTTVRLSHIGNYKYSWEDAGLERPRFETFTLNFGNEHQHGFQIRQTPSLQNLLQEFAWTESPASSAETVSGNQQQTEISAESLDILNATIPRDAGFVLVVGDASGKIARRVVNIASDTTVVICNDWQQGTESKGTYAEYLGRFYSDNWSYRDRIYPIPKPLKESLLIVAEAHVPPDRIFLDFEVFAAMIDWNETFRMLTDMFPRSIILGNGWERAEIQENLKRMSDETDRGLEFRELTWRLSPPRQERTSNLEREKTD